MRSRVQKWGNSLAVRIPKPFAEEAGLTRETPVEISLRSGTIVVARLRPKNYSLSALLGKVKKSNRHREIETGPPVGREIW